MRIRFGEYTLDDGRRQLLRAGEEVHLSPKAYELLKLLLAMRPHAVSKSDLQARLWPDAFVSEVNLAALVAEVRAALGEAGRHGRFIRTVHGFGYAFDFQSAIVEEDGRAAAPATPSIARVECWLTWGEVEFPLREGEQIIGRGRSADVRIEALSISREHARLRWDGAMATIEDLGSKNGTSIAGTRILGPTRIGDGDQIRIGTVTLVFHNLRAPASTVTIGHAGT